AGPDAILIPKVEQAAHIQSVAQHLQSAGSQAQIWAMIETPLAIVNIAEIARSATQLPLGCLVVGTNDLVKETRATLDSGRAAALYWLSAIVTAGRAYEIDVLDGVYNNFSDLSGFERECQQGRMFGMDGKTLIHPSQIHGANAVFTPSKDDVAWARKIIEAFEEPENKVKGVITLEGKMVELLHAESARRTVAIAQAIGL
ncbi:MAG: HpcH/HpaI aldolase/citrate lyase family protein, partial [Hyphomicrobiaceae bacterium]